MRKMEIKRPVVLGVIAAIFGIIIYLSYNARNKLINHGRLTQGIIVGEDRTYRGYLVLEYEFNVEGKKFTNTRDLVGLVVMAGRDFQGKSFPILYDPQDPSLNDILITPKGFGSYNREFPDSLNWVKNYLK
ncbi:hypothetical protein [Chitinophaga tropicalis]|uniref:DUF3592 domain-containing protein n=1 Tax=Chitinophaga tropicalis TaxID=2683588 RepID=A0A7K1U762_9BACT|nr:hypothetical protein [Chitinophaga tropicalis]MVT10198.1 hypothetical protein [Chitinophaga tropicalis]